MTGTTSLTTETKKSYNETEQQFILKEFTNLAAARQETYSNSTLREWIKTFWDKKLTANQVCKKIRAVKDDLKIFGKVTLNDFLDADISEIADIITEAQKQEHYYAYLICGECGRATTIQKKDLYNFAYPVKICEHKELTPDTIKTFYSKVTCTFTEIIV